MRNGIVTLLLLTCIGLDGPTGIALSTNAAQADKDTDHSGCPPSGPSCIALATTVAQPAYKPACGSGYLVRVSPICDWRSVELLDVARQFTKNQTLQSQHVLLRI